MIRVILVDDRKSHLKNLVDALQLYHADIEVIGAFTDTRTAIAQIIHQKPDGLFLDIEMPGKSGFKLAESVKQVCPLVIYLTNYMGHGSEAFRQGALFLIDKSSLEEYLPDAIAKLRSALPSTSLTVNAAKTGFHQLDKIVLKEVRCIEITVSGNQRTLIKNIKLSLENYRTLSKFVAFRLLGNLLHAPINFTVNQIQDRALFRNLSQSKSHFISNVNKALSEDHIKLKQECFFVAEESRYSLALDMHSIVFPAEKTFMEKWITCYVKPILEDRKLALQCYFDNGHFFLK